MRPTHLVSKIIARTRQVPCVDGEIARLERERLALLHRIDIIGSRVRRLAGYDDYGQPTT